jgi:hypothetical protein
MAQAFEILMETGQRPGHAFLPDGILTSYPDTRSRSPFPAGRPHPLDRYQQYGTAFGSPQARKWGPTRPAAGPIPGPAILPRLINPVGFDKKSVGRLSGH